MDKLKAEQLLHQQKGITNEILWANIFHDTIIGSKWLHNQPFSPGRAAIGYPTLYALYRILDEFQPKSILEMGLGQSTKMIGSYVKWKVNRNEECSHIVVEHDKTWIDFFNNSFELSSGTKVVQLDLSKVEIDASWVDGGKTEVNIYVGVGEQLKEQKFDLIFIDGPFGSPVYSRIDIIDLIPECLNESFILMLDDAERHGEQNTLTLIRNFLAESGIKHCMNYYTGQKATAIITSPELHFYCTM